jgi:hypothetical protein
MAIKGTKIANKILKEDVHSKSPFYLLTKKNAFIFWCWESKEINLIYSLRFNYTHIVMWKVCIIDTSINYII